MLAGRRTSSPARRRSSPRSTPRPDRCSSRAAATPGRCRARRPPLAAEGVPLLGPTEWTAQQSEWLEQYFEREVEPVLSPLGLDPARPFPRIQNKSLNFIVRLEGKDAFDRDSELAIVQAPRSLPRV